MIKRTRLTVALLSGDQQRISEYSGTNVFDAVDELLVVELRGKLEIVSEEQFCGDEPQLLFCKGLP